MGQLPLVISSCNWKGGCFKSSGTYHLGGAFAESGSRVLLIDCDPQASLTQTFFGSNEVERLEPEQTVAAIFALKVADPQSLVYDTAFENLSIIPGTYQLIEHNHPKPAEAGWVQVALRQFVSEVSSEFDIVLIDTPPNLQLLTWASMVASQYILTPVVPEDYAAQGLVHVKRFIEAIQETKNADLQWLGLLIAMVQSRIAVHQAYEKLIRATYGDLVLETVVPHAAAFKEALAERKPMTVLKPRSTQAKAIRNLRDEILVRCGLELPKTAKSSRTKPKTPRKKRGAA